MIQVNEPLLNGNEKKYLTECIDSGWISSEGPFVKKFEDIFAGFVNRKHGIAVANGTAAIDIAVAVSGLQKGDEIILPSFTIISCILEILRRGIVPVWIDADPLTWNMDVAGIESKLSAKTKAIMVVHIYGLPTDMDQIISLSEKYNLIILEDASEAHGLKYKDKPCGSFGLVSTFSFYANKIITTGEGGMVLTDDDRLAEKIRDYRNLHFQSHQRFVHEEIGWNYRMTNLQAAMGVAQMERADEFIKKKKHIGIKYLKHLVNLSDEIQFPPLATDYAENIFWIFGLVLKKDNLRHELISYLTLQGIGTRPFFYPLHKQPVLTKFGLSTAQNLPVTEKLSENGFYIPSGIAITDEQIEFVSDKINQFFEGRRNSVL